jgi:hypothetical protein
MKTIYVSILSALLLIQCQVKESIIPKPSAEQNADATKANINARSAATTFYVSTTGNDAADGSSATPWKTLRYAVSKTPANLDYTIILSAGTFVENGLIEVPLGVNIIGAGIDQTILKAASSFYYYPASPSYATDKFLISLNASSLIAGNQLLNGFTIDGDLRKLHGGIYVRYRSNVTLDGVKVMNTHFMGIWLWDVQYSKLTNSQLINCSWGSSSYCVGSLNLGSLDHVEISNLTVDENTGYGIKAIGPSGANNIFNTTIHNSRISVSPVGLWNSGTAPNIAIELWSINLVACQIYNTYVDNTISLVNNNGLPSTGIQTMRVHHNTLDMDTRAHGAGYGLELTIHDAEVDHNYFLKGNYGIANWASAMKNWSIHHNTFYGLQNAYPGEVVRSQGNGLHNVKLYNNTIEFAGTKTMNVVGVYAGVSDNVDIENNLFINNNTSYSYYPNQLVHAENGAIVNILTVKNNSFYKLPIGTVAGTYSNNLTSDPLITMTGARPDPYYMPKSGSPLINTGLNVGYTFVGTAPDIGALEFGGVATNALPQVSISSPVSNAKFTVGSTVTIAANATDTDGTIAKVEFFNGTTKLGEDLTSPYSFGWVNVVAGSYSLTAKATDNQNGVSTSAIIAISVGATNQPPVVSLTSPVNNSTFAAGASVTITAVASDVDGTVSKVEFFNGSTKLGEDLTSPYSFVWSAAAGNITAKATDNVGATATSISATVTVSASSATTLTLDSYAAVLSGKMTQGSDAQAMGGSYFYVAPGNGNNYAIPPPGSAAFNFQLAKTDNYVIWAKVKSPTSSNQTSYVYNGKGKWMTWSAGVNTSWTWVRITDSGATALFPFVQGANQFQIAWLNENMQIDQVVITNDLNYVGKG